MPALIVNFDEVLFRCGGASPRPDAIRLIQDASAASWDIALTSALTQVEVRKRLSPFLSDLAETALVAGSDFVDSATENIVDFAAGKLRTSPERTLALESGEAGFLRANAAGIPNIVVMAELPSTDNFQHTQLVINRFGLPDDSEPITVFADINGVNPHPFVTVAHLKACLEPFHRRLNEFGVIRGGK